MNICISLQRGMAYCLLFIVTGCALSGGKEPFQVYAPRNDCVACEPQEKWGFIKKTIVRNGKVVYFASFQPKESATKFQIERIGLCYGMALDTLKMGATHFRILDKEKWGDWYTASTPAEVHITIGGDAEIYGSGVSRRNRDQSGMWWTNQYYEVAKPDCDNDQEKCSVKHKYNVTECPYGGDALRNETEFKKGSLSCVMKRNPKLLLDNVYSDEAGCGFPKMEKSPINIDQQTKELFDKELDAGYWVSSQDIIRKFEMFFEAK